MILWKKGGIFFALKISSCWCLLPGSVSNKCVPCYDVVAFGRWTSGGVTFDSRSESFCPENILCSLRSSVVGHCRVSCFGNDGHRSTTMMRLQKCRSKPLWTQTDAQDVAGWELRRLFFCPLNCNGRSPDTGWLEGCCGLIIGACNKNFIFFVPLCWISLKGPPLALVGPTPWQSPKEETCSVPIYC